MHKPTVSPPLSLRRLLAATLLCLATDSCLAQAPVIRDAWVRGTAAGQHVTSAYMIIESPNALLITGAHSPRADRVELRTMEIADKGPLQAKTAECFTVLAHEPLRLTPLTDHFMLIGIQPALQVGERVPLILQYRLANGQQGEISVDAPVRPFYAKPVR